MSYNKKTWINGEIIYTEALNNIENGIEAVEKNIPKKTSQLENDSGYITVTDFNSVNNRVKALEKVEHVSLEQYNILLNRVALLEEALNDLKSEEPVSIYSVTNNLTNVSTNNPTTSIKEGQSYNATLTCGNDYDISSVVITMNGVNVTNSVYDPEDPEDPTT